MSKSVLPPTVKEDVAFGIQGIYGIYPEKEKQEKIREVGTKEVVPR